ncbi:MAG: YbaB/EbfC family nucleoid-associated protein [Alphaproteobacteria bacterium]|nr:YbaB/EbfC family nucleoid-associated protein [Alphaproteobacteria bacterium]
MDIETLMANAKNLQAKIAKAQESLAAKRVKGIAGDGAVVVDMTGKYDLISVTINPDVLSRGAKALSELVADAYRDAKQKADILIDEVMTKTSGGISLN